MGNQPFSVNGEAMELPAGDAGSWTLMSCSIFYEFGNGEMEEGAEFPEGIASRDSLLLLTMECILPFI